jgi:hypothetical protein
MANCCKEVVMRLGAGFEDGEGGVYWICKDRLLDYYQWEGF